MSRPVNHEAIRINMNFTSASPTASIEAISFIWVGDTAKKIYAHYVAGANGGKGFTEGLPYRIKPCNGLFQFDLMLDGQNASTLLSCDEVQIPIKQAGRVEQITLSSDSVSFWYLFSTQVIQPADFKLTPYCLSSIPNGTTIVVLLLAEFMVIWQAIDLVNKIQELITKIAGDLSFAPVSAGVLAADIIIAAAFCIYAYTLINMFIQLAVEIKKNIIQGKKYKLCMREEDIWKKICSYYQLNFVSPIYAVGSKDRDATYMPPKIVMPQTGQSILNLFDRPENEGTNAHCYGYPDGTIQNFFREMIIKYDGDITITNSTLYFKNKHDWNVFTPVQLPNTAEMKNTFNEPQPWSTNLSELNPTLIIKFPLDDSDPNVKHKYRGTSVRVQINHPNRDYKYDGWGSAKEVVMPFALAKRKDYLNEVEWRFDLFINGISAVVQIIVAPINALISIVNAVINLFGGNAVTIPTINPIPTNPLQQRIGWLETWNDSFSLPKTFNGMQSGGDWILQPTSEVDCSAKGLLDRYYGLNLPTRGGQFKVYREKEFKNCCDYAVKLLSNNIFLTPDQSKKGKFVYGEWVLDKDIVEQVHYRIRENYCNIFTESIIENETQ